MVKGGGASTFREGVSFGPVEFLCKTAVGGGTTWLERRSSSRSFRSLLATTGTMRSSRKKLSNQKPQRIKILNSYHKERKYK